MSINKTGKWVAAETVLRGPGAKGRYGEAFYGLCLVLAFRSPQLWMQVEMVWSDFSFRGDVLSLKEMKRPIKLIGSYFDIVTVGSFLAVVLFVSFTVQDTVAQSSSASSTP